MKKTTFQFLLYFCRVIMFLPRILYPYKIHDFANAIIMPRIRSLWLHSSFKNCHETVTFGKIGRIHGSECISIGEKTHIGDYFYLTTWPERVKEKPSLKIGTHCNFGAFSHITCTHKMDIGDHVLTGKWVSISDNNHGNSSIEQLQMPPNDRPIESKGAVVIEDNVWIGDKATILSGVHIGKAAIIAANAVVTKDVPAYCVAAGNPAKIVKENNQQQ